MGSSSSKSRYASIIWLPLGFVAWLGIGIAGYWAISLAWRAIHVAEFRRTVAAVAALAPSHPWIDPWESDPEWQLLEKQISTDLVPLTAHAAKFEEEGIGIVFWVPSPTGRWRATVTFPLAERAASDGPKRPSGVVAIRGTQIFDHANVAKVWWITWTSLNLFLALAWYWIGRWHRRDVSDWRSELQPWFDEIEITASVTNRRPKLSLPRLLGHDSVMVERLNAVAEYVNSEIARLDELVARLDLIFGNLSEGVLAIDEQGRTLIANSALRSQFQLGSEDYSLKPLVEVIRVPRVVELVEHVLSTGKSEEQTVEYGSTTRFMRLLASPLPIGNGRSGVLLTVIDVSSQQRSELARREFIAGASHEFKTPLSAIRAYTETVQTIFREDHETAHRFLESILAQADRMDHLVNGMMQLARAESGTLKLNLHCLDAVATIQPCLDAMQQIAHSKALVLKCHLPPTPLLVNADRDALQTIANNLLSNAARYTGAGGTIDVELVLDAPCAVLRVTDTGIGISEADQDRIFERFYRVEKDRAQYTGGTGLGLAIVKQLTKVLGGSITVSSRQGVGTCFEIRLPAVGFTQSSSNLGG